MRTIPLSASLACLVAAYGLAISPDATGATYAAFSVNIGSTCQLSIPTTDTGVRPKASGFRNESTTVSSFVICPVSSAFTPSGGGNLFTYLLLRAHTFDGVVRGMTCTAVVGETGYLGTTTYSSKGANVGGGGAYFQWTAADFGGTAGAAITASAISSITCNLPRQTAILHTEGGFEYYIGT